MAEQLGSNYYNTPFKFNGKELDEETGLYYYGARYYDPRTGPGFLSVDPSFESYPGVNPYVYCMQNPVNMIDPDGREPVPSYYRLNLWYTLKSHAGASVTLVPTKKSK